MEASIPPASRFGAGLPESEVRRFQAILRETRGIDVAMPEAWALAIELLTLIETLLGSDEFALPRT